MPRHILVFGGTSPSGIDFCLAALRDGHILILYVRNPSKLPSEVADNVTTVTGELTNANAIEEAIKVGAKTCVSFLGPVAGLRKGHTPIADSYGIILPLLKQYGYTRTLFVSTASYHDPADKFSLVFSAMIWMLWLFMRPPYTEINAMTPQIVALPSEMNWTVFRVPLLRNGEARLVKAGMIGETGINLERKAMAEWLLEEMEVGRWVGKCPAISNA